MIFDFAEYEMSLFNNQMFVFSFVAHSQRLPEIIGRRRNRYLYRNRINYVPVQVDDGNTIPHNTFMQTVHFV